jgi:hypothetical protein
MADHSTRFFEAHRDTDTRDGVTRLRQRNQRLSEVLDLSGRIQADLRAQTIQQTNTLAGDIELF